jgi:hypothetical protein
MQPKSVAQTSPITTARRIVGQILLARALFSIF